MARTQTQLWIGLGFLLGGVILQGLLKRPEAKPPVTEATNQQAEEFQVAGLQPLPSTH